MRLTRRRLTTFVLRRMTLKTDATGGKSLAYDPAVFPEISFDGILLAPKRRLDRTETGVHISLVWRVLTDRAPPVFPRDQVRLLGETTPVFTVTNVKPYPGHTEIDMEVIQ